MMADKRAAEHQKLLKNLNIAVQVCVIFVHEILRKQYLLVQAKGQTVLLQTAGVLGLRQSLEAILLHGLKGTVMLVETLMVYSNLVECFAICCKQVTRF